MNSCSQGFLLREPKIRIGHIGNLRKLNVQDLNSRENFQKKEKIQQKLCKKLRKKNSRETLQEIE